ncbi:hypothetical protein CFC21_046386 [Triticum aestivum]|uniref:Zinc-finger domain-containing protein n=2 Tax=Triticum aestivum TaxID=4565 RepID=A0A9R1FW31_WHEAT|nr:uncharacterized protein LOC123077552 [Triticum aestivum]KAF7035521.1 hypothetical protein CFC21_046386 [Triticum aestivum]
MATTRPIASAEASPASQAKRRGRPPKAPLAAEVEAPRTPSPMSPLTAAAEGYEREREARIKENMERMQKLGLVDLATCFNQSATPAGAGTGTGRGRWRRRPETPGSPAAAAPRIRTASPMPARRSLRLKSVEPVRYVEICEKKEKGLDGGRPFSIEEGCKEEVYTEEHEKLLGTCGTPWTLFVDGYGKDGKRIYDQVRGQTCHQCRQKTLGHHTRCCNCQIVQGQFCGDCLYMRYGENVLEAKSNPNWTCPVCRGICNCSICRTKRGWFPTGNAYRKVVRLGYKSVAHYLIATNRAGANSGDSSSADSSNELPSAGEVSEHKAPVAKQDADLSSNAMNDAGEVEQKEGNMKKKAAAVKDEAKAPRKKITADVVFKDDGRSESGVTFDSLERHQDVGCVTPSKPEPKKKRKWVEARSPDCVASRLRSRSAPKS